MKYIIATVLIVLGVTTYVIVFKDAPTSIVSEVPLPTPQKEAKNIYGSWKWIKTIDYSQNIIVPKNPDAFVLTITPEGKLMSTTDCNSITGSVIINGEIISIGALSITEMACGGEVQETMYLNDLARATSYTIEGSTLTVQQIKDFGVMTFEWVSE